MMVAYPLTISFFFVFVAELNRFEHDNVRPRHFLDYFDYSGGEHIVHDWDRILSCHLDEIKMVLNYILITRYFCLL